MDFDKLVEVYEELEKTPSGNKMREILSDFFKVVPVKDISIVSYLTLGQIASEFEGVVLGMAEKSVLKAIAVASGMEIGKLQKILDETGDIGLTAEKALQKKPRTLVPVGKLMIQELFEKLHKIGVSQGTGSQDVRQNIIASLLQKTSAKGAKYLTRIVLGTLRMGVGDMTVLDALAIAFTGEKKNKEFLERAYNICPDVGIIADTIATKGLKGLEKISIHVGRPIKMMLAQRVDALEDVAERMPGAVAVEGKYDGERVQAHKDKRGEIILFSRRLENITSQFPDLVLHLEKHIKAKEFVVEGEIVAIDGKGRPLPFQTLMQRRRKYDIEQYAKDIPIQLKLFDVLYSEGKEFMEEPYEKRIKELSRILKEGEGVMPADRIITSDLVEVETFFHSMLDHGYEGIIIKSLSGEYQAGTRGWNWIKWKKEYVKEMIDTFDLVVVGAYYGRGKRSGGYGALLCAVYNSKNDTFETLCKLGTGLTDDMLESLPSLLDKFKVERKPGRVAIKKEMEPDVWFEPRIVVEVLAAEITKSPFHTAGSGLALRFPRFVRLRENKKAEQATTSQEVEGMERKK